MVKAPTAAPAGRSSWLFSAGLVAVVLGVFWPVLGFEFVRWDDDINITQNPLLTQPWSGSLVVQFFRGDQAMRFKPVHWLLDRGVHGAVGFDPTGWHALNLALHLIATLMFCSMLRRVLALLTPTSGALAINVTAFLGAACWAIHPLRAEVVAWATASPYSLVAVLLLASFACYLRAYDDPSRKRWIIASWIFAVAAYASYPVGLAFGVWLIIADLWLLPRRNDATSAWQTGSRGWWLKHAAFLAPAFLAAGVTVWTRYASPGIFGEAPAVESVGVVSRLTMALAALSYLVGRFFWWTDLTPNMPPLQRDALMSAPVLLIALLALGAMVFALTTSRKTPRAAAVVLGFAAIAFPCLGWTERPTWPVDRYSYLVHLIFVGGIAAAGWKWASEVRARRSLLVAAGLAFVGVSAAGARRQAMIWENTDKLFTYFETDPKFRESPRQAGHIYVLWGYDKGAHAQMQQAAFFLNQAQEVYLAAMREAVHRDDYREALSLLTHWERHFPLTAPMRREKGAWLLRVDRPSEALRELHAAESELHDDPRLKSLLAEADKAIKERAPRTSSDR